jgi:nicotinamide mononucleotide transporter
LNILSIEYIVFHIGNYPLSLIELVGTVTGLLSVWWAARTNILTWPTGIINIFCFFLLFFQTQLYSDMLLQVFFMATTAYGWRSWAKGALGHKIEISSIRPQKWTLYLVVLLAGTLLWGLLMSNINQMLPQLFPKKAALPYADAFTAIASVIATFMLARKKWESWLLWVVVDAISVFVYFYKGLYVVAIEYIIFFGIAGYGLFNWYRKREKVERKL